MSEWLFVGTYSRNGSEGVYAVPFCAASGKLGTPSVLAPTDATGKNPSWVSVGGNGKSLLVVGETERSSVASLPILPHADAAPTCGDGTMLVSPTSGPWADACYVAEAAGGDAAVVCNYTSGEVVSVPLAHGAILSSPPPLVVPLGAALRTLGAPAAVADGAVVRRADAHWGEVPVAFVALRRPVAVDELKAWCRERVAHFKVPREWRLVDLQALPRSSTGKIARRELQALLRPAG